MSMKQLSLAMLASMLMMQATLAADAVVNVNGQPIKKSWMDLVKKSAQESGRTANDNAIANAFVRNELLAQEAVRMGMDRNPEFQTREEIRRQELLANMLVADYQKRNPITDAMIRAEYDKQKRDLVGVKEFKLRHILVKTETQAKDVMKQLSGKKADFAKIARQVSKDDKTKDNGGDTGWVRETTLRGELRDSVIKLNKGAHTSPVQSKNGWHIVKMEDQRPFVVPALDNAVKTRLTNALRQAQTEQLVKELRARARVEVVK